MCLVKYKTYHEKENKGVGTAIIAAAVVVVVVVVIAVVVVIVLTNDACPYDTIYKIETCTKHTGPSSMIHRHSGTFYKS